MEAFTISTSSIFGMTVRDANLIGTKASARLALFVILLFGSVFFYTYGGELYSSLAIPSDYQPFKSPEELHQTSYRY
jgi:hypothetical protein